MNIRQILKTYHIGNSTLDASVNDVVAWSDARCSTRGKLTPELIKAISQKIEDDYMTARGFCKLHLSFSPGYLSNLKKGNKQLVTDKVMLLCEVLGIRIDEYVIIGL